MLKLAAALALGAGAFAAGCGRDDDTGSEGLASLAPPDAPVFIDGVVRPEGDQAEAIESFAERVAGISDPGARLIAELDASLAENGLDVTYAEDIEPWLGDEIAVFISSLENVTDQTVVGDSTMPDFAAIVEVDDVERAEEFLQKVYDQDPPAEEAQRRYDGTDYTLLFPGIGVGIVDDRALAFGTETGIKLATDASNGESLAESEEYTERIDALPDDPLVSAQIEPAAAIEAAIASGDVAPKQARVLEPLLSGPLSEPVVATLSADTETASIDVAATVDSGISLSTESSLLTDLPGDAWFAAGVPDLGSTLERVLDQLSASGLQGAGMIERQVREATGLGLGDDVLRWLGDTAAYVQGTAVPGLSAGLIAQTSDPEGPRKLLEAVRRLAEEDSGFDSGGPPEGAEYGFSIGVPGIGGGAEAGVIGDELVAVFGSTVDQALEPSETLGDNSSYQEAAAALGDDLPTALYVDVPTLLAVAELGSDGDLDYESIRPYADAFASLVAGGRIKDGLALSRITVLLEDE
jgi:hypothetical protein